MSYLSLSTANRAATRNALLLGTVSLAAPSGFGVTRVTSLPTVTPRFRRHAVTHHDLVCGRADAAGGEVAGDGGVSEEIGRLAPRAVAAADRPCATTITSASMVGMAWSTPGICCNRCVRAS